MTLIEKKLIEKKKEINRKIKIEKVIFCNNIQHALQTINTAFQTKTKGARFAQLLALDDHELLKESGDGDNGVVVFRRNDFRENARKQVELLAANLFANYKPPPVTRNMSYGK
jgi:hypothetical protein